jgi:hypothetical protein
METFYKIEVPKGEESRHEYRQLKVSAAESNLWRLRQFHGWWDEASRDPSSSTHPPHAPGSQASPVSPYL